MELEHAFQQSGFLAAFQLMVAASLFAPGFLIDRAAAQRLARTAASYIVSFGPMAILIYVLYHVCRLS